MMRDIVFVLGTLTAAAGCWLIHPAVGLIFSGAVAVVIAMSLRGDE